MVKIGMNLRRRFTTNLADNDHLMATLLWHQKFYCITSLHY